MVLFCGATFLACLAFNAAVLTVVPPRLDARTTRNHLWFIPLSLVLASWAALNLLHVLGEPRLHDGMEIVAYSCLGASALVLWGVVGALRTGRRHSAMKRSGRGRRPRYPRH